MFSAVEKILQRLTRLAAIAGGAGLLFAVGVTCASIFGKLLRRLLNAALDGGDSSLPSWIGPILGEEELVQYAVGIALFAALPWLTLQKGHIGVDLLKDFLGEKTNRLLDFLGQFFFAGIVYLIMTQQWFLIFYKTRHGQDGLAQLLFDGDWAEFSERLRRADESQILGIPLWPMYAAAEACVVLLFIVSVFCLLRGGRDLAFCYKKGDV